VGGIVDTKLNTAVVPVTKTVTDMAAPVNRFRPVPMNWFPPLESKKKTNWSVKGGGEKQKGPMGAAFAGVPTPPSSPTIIPTMTNNLFMPSSPFVAVQSSSFHGHADFPLRQLSNMCSDSSGDLAPIEVDGQGAAWR
jgi:hypothetical protein